MPGEALSAELDVVDAVVMRVLPKKLCAASSILFKIMITRDVLNPSKNGRTSIRLSLVFSGDGIGVARWPVRTLIKFAYPTYPNGKVKTSAKSAPNATRRFIKRGFKRSNVTSCCTESAFIPIKEIDPILPIEISQNK